MREADKVPGPTYPYSCPVCGVGLIHSDLQGPDEGYFCPYCSTKQKPSPRVILEDKGSAQSPGANGRQRIAGR